MFFLDLLYTRKNPIADKLPNIILTFIIQSVFYLNKKLRSIMLEEHENKHN